MPLKLDGKTACTGRADGVFAHSAKAWSKGTHTVAVTGRTTIRAGKPTVKIAR